MNNMRLLPQSNPRGYGTARGSVDKTDHPRFSSLVSVDYWDALHVVLSDLEKTGEYYDQGPLPFSVRILGHIYHLNDNIVRRDLIRLRKAMVA